MKKTLGFLSALLIVFVFLTLSLPIQTAAAGPKPIVLRFAHSTSPKSRVHSHFLTSWVKEVKEATNGRVRIEVYPSATLVDKKALLEGVERGRADIVWGATLYWRGRFQLSEVLSLPMLGIKDGETASRIYWRLVNEFPEMKAEYGNTKILFTHYIGPYVLTTAKKPVTKLSDVKGLKIRAGGGVQTEMMKIMGAAPSYLGMIDLYQALDKGVMDGALLPWEAISSFKFYEVADYVFDEPFSGTTCFAVMNKKKWESLPPDIQKAIENLSYENASARLGRLYDIKGEALEIIRKDNKKLQISNLDPSSRAQWEKKLKPVWEKWVEETNAKGLPGQKVLDRTLELVKELSK